MADKNSVLNLLSSQQSQKEVAANSLFNAMSPAAFGGKNDYTTSGLVFGIYGGNNGDVHIDNTTVNLTNNATNYIYFDDSTNTFSATTTVNTALKLCYILTTSGGIITDQKECRPNFLTLSGGSGGSDPNFKANNNPTTNPVADQTNAIAIGDSSESRGQNSFSANGGKANSQGSVAIGPNNSVNGNFSISMGGTGNAVNSARSGSYASRDCTISAQNEYNFILNSYSSTITSSAYDYNTIINSNQCAISSNGSTIVNGLFSYIETDGQYSFLSGRNGSINIPFTYQYSYSTNVKHQRTGLSRETSTTSETPLQLGDGTANVKNFKIKDNQLVNIVITLLGCTSSGDSILFKDEVLVKRFSSVTEFIGESSTTEKILTVTKSTSGLSATTARIIVSGNDIIIGVTPNTGSSIQWSCEFDQIICQRS